MYVTYDDPLATLAGTNAAKVKLPQRGNLDYFDVQFGEFSFA
jgi:hypothetical protein